MLSEAVSKSPSPDMDRANYTGSIEVRPCAIESHGRGLFTTKDVNAGELLLCEKSFAAVFADPDQQQPVGRSRRKQKEEEGGDGPDEETLWRSLERRDELVAKTLVKLHRNPSLQGAFADLYPGPGWVDERDEETGEPVMDEWVIPRSCLQL